MTAEDFQKKIMEAQMAITETRRVEQAQMAAAKPKNKTMRMIIDITAASNGGYIVGIDGELFVAGKVDELGTLILAHVARNKLNGDS